MENKISTKELRTKLRKSLDNIKDYEKLIKKWNAYTKINKNLPQVSTNSFDDLSELLDFIFKIETIETIDKDISKNIYLVSKIIRDTFYYLKTRDKPYYNINHKFFTTGLIKWKGLDVLSCSSNNSFYFLLIMEEVSIDLINDFYINYIENTNFEYE